MDQALPVTDARRDLVKRTVAKGATDEELDLFFYDCRRQGVHPLDKLIHFTKRKDKYTPITSIDFMRMRAAATKEYAGSDPASFEKAEDGQPLAAKVTVYRLVQGQRCPWTAIARYDEYKPEAGPSGQGDVMWRKMPHVMLEKCAEALALRKAFPAELHGMYAKEEMDQAGPTAKEIIQNRQEEMAEHKTVAELLATPTPAIANFGISHGDPATPPVQQAFDAMRANLAMTTTITAAEDTVRPFVQAHQGTEHLDWLTMAGDALSEQVAAIKGGKR